MNEKSIDGGLGTRTQGGRVVGAEESTELWRHPVSNLLKHFTNVIYNILVYSWQISSLVVFVGDLCSKGHKFESQNRILDGYFYIDLL